MFHIDDHRLIHASLGLDGRAVELCVGAARGPDSE